MRYYSQYRCLRLTNIRRQICFRSRERDHIVITRASSPEKDQWPPTNLEDGDEPAVYIPDREDYDILLSYEIS